MSSLWRRRCMGTAARSHGHAIQLKAEIMVDHSRDLVVAQDEIGGAARVVWSTHGIKRAVQYYHAIHDYLDEANGDGGVAERPRRDRVRRYLAAEDRDRLDPILDGCVAVYRSELDEDRRWSSTAAPKRRAHLRLPIRSRLRATRHSLMRTAVYDWSCPRHGPTRQGDENTGNRATTRACWVLRARGECRRNGAGEGLAEPREGRQRLRRQPVRRETSTHGSMRPGGRHVRSGWTAAPRLLIVLYNGDFHPRRPAPLSYTGYTRAEAADHQATGFRGAILDTRAESHDLEQYPLARFVDCPVALPSPSSTQSGFTGVHSIDWISFASTLFAVLDGEIGMSVKQRLAIFVFLIALVGVLFFLPRTNPEIQSEEVTAILVSAMVLVSFYALLLEHFFTRPTDVIAAGVSILLLLIPSRALLAPWGVWYWVFGAYEGIAVLLATVSLLLLTEKQAVSSRRNRISTILKALTTRLASGKAQYFLLSLFTVIFFVETKATSLIVFFLYGVIVMVFQPHNFISKLPNIARKEVPKSVPF